MRIPLYHMFPLYSIMEIIVANVYNFTIGKKKLSSLDVVCLVLYLVSRKRISLTEILIGLTDSCMLTYVLRCYDSVWCFYLSVTSMSLLPEGMFISPHASLLYHLLSVSTGQLRI